LDIESIKKECYEEMNKEQCYKMFVEQGFQYGEKFQNIEKLYKGNNAVLSYLSLCDNEFLNYENHVMHATIIDACFQGMISVMSNSDNKNKSFLPINVEKMLVYNKPQKNMVAYTFVTATTEKYMKGNIILCDMSGNIILEMEGFTVRNTNNDTNVNRNALEQSAYDFQWYNAEVINELGYQADLEKQGSNVLSKKGIWIIFDDNADAGKKLTQSLTERNQKCINIITGEEYKFSEGEEVISINPSKEDEFDKLLSDITEKDDLEIRGAVHLWNLKAENESNDNIDAEYIEKFQSIGCMSIIHFIKACERKNLSVPIWIITRGVQAINNEIDVKSLPQSAVWGLGRIIAYQEYPNMFGALIDLDPSHPNDEIECIIDEMQNESCENQIAFRNGVRYFARIVKSEIQANKIPSKFDADKSYLITGGFGALGKLVIEFMIKNGARRFILFSRTKLLERKEWKNIEKGTELENKINFIKKMERMGATLHIAAVDVSNFNELKQYINDYYDMEWPEVGGVIHCAGIIKDKLISNMNEEDFNSVLKPKVGAWNLHRVFENSKLDFFVLFSSVASTINITMGQANYASANSFMDVLSSYRKEKGLPSVSINWGPWGDVGMASENDLVGYFRSKGIESITPKQGIEILKNVLNYSKSQIVILDAQWNVLEKSFSKENIPSSIFYLCKQNAEALKEEENIGDGIILKDILKLANPAEKKEKLREYLVSIITKLFGAKVGELNNDRSLVEMGMDSLMATDIKRSIEAVFNVKISMVELMQGISINKLSDKVSGDLSNNEIQEINKNNDTNIKVEHNTKDLYEAFPLTDVQMAYFTGRKDDFVLGGVSPHIYMELSTHINIEKFNESLNKLIEIHPMLRTIFLESGKQQILENIPKYKIDIKDISDYSKGLKDKEIMVLRDKLSHKVFNPLEWPLFQISGLKLSDEETYLFIGVDMLITDGTGFKEIGDELSNIYYNKGENIEKIDFNYKDFMVGYEKLKATRAYEIDKKYWLDKLDAFPKSPSFEFKVLPQDIGKSHFKRLKKVLDKDEFKKLKQLANEHGISISVLFCTVYAMALSYWSNQDNLGLNVTVFNRQPFNDEVYKLIGDFTSLILLEVDFSEEGSFWDKAKRVNKSLSEALEHSLFDGVEFMRELGKRNDIFEGLVMPVVFTSLISEDGRGLNGWTSLGTIENALSQTPQVYLDNQLIEIDGQLSIVLDYVENLFYEHDVENMYDKYIETVHLLANEGDISNVRLPIMDTEIIRSYNNTEEVINSDTTLQELFVNQVNKTPNKTAVKFEDKAITYKELDEKSNLVSVYLKQQGVKPGDHVAIIAKRGIEAIINIVGIVKLGAAYIPVNEDYPQDRIDYIMENAKCKCIIDNYLSEKVDLSIYSKEMVELDNHFDATAYIIYTSGSTGRPKGVAISHKAVVNTILDINRKFDVIEEDKIIGLSSMNFDLSIYDIFGALVSGATLVMIPNIKDVENIMATIKKEEITIWNSVPSVMGVLLESINEYSNKDILFSQMAESEIAAAVDYDNNTSLRLVMLSGDWIPLDLPEKITSKFMNVQVVSLGGATEASIWSIHYIINKIDKSWKSIPYGMPLGNQKIYILNNKLELCPVNVQGEIYIGGIGVAQEYFNDAEKTQKAFINHPTLGRIYKTGDYGIFRREGYVEFLGRKDNQVKINGNRVELGEVERCLKDIDAIKNAVAIDFNSKNSKYLCAYVISDEKLEDEKIKNALSKQLPEYMIPLQYISIDHIPLSANGKVDRKMLPAAGSIELNVKYLAPRNEVEEVLENMCKEILESDENISIDESLYNWGWNSIKMILFSAKVKNHFNVDIPFAVLSKYTTIKNIGEFILNRNCNEQKICQVFNEKMGNKIFAFPSLLTFGMVYKEISKVIDNQSIYAFDYINEDNIFDIYVDKILEIQKQGPYNFIGYSSGGSIAYEVAKQLESRGLEVENIILIDAPYGVSKHFANMEQKLIDDFRTENIDIVLNKLMRNSSDKATIKTNLEKRIDQYIDMLINKCSADKKVSSNLYYIEANETIQDYRSKVRYMDSNWKNITEGSYHHYDGYGNHDEMMFDDFVVKNAEIINKVLSRD
jgi:amino acid adenylation domain-containing protein